MEIWNDDQLIKIVQMLNSTTKMDTILIDENGKVLFQLINHPIPPILGHPDREYDHMNEILSKQPPHYCFHYINTYALEYLAAAIWQGASFVGSLAMGPFVSSMSIADQIKDIIYKNNLPVGERKQLEQFYQSLPVLSELEYRNLGDLLVNMCGHDYIRSHLHSSEILKPLLNQDRLKESVEENKEIIESRYKIQNKIMDALARGNKEEVSLLISQMPSLMEFSDRIPESPIRASKNLAFVLNTLFRVAAERGGVHPIYLHNISERFAILIERTKNIPELNKLTGIMINEYCDLVNTYATGHYSSIVKKAVDYIQLNLGNTLTLNRIAEDIHVNPSYLSRKFKEETQMTISEFINQKRVDEAKLYLQRGNKSVTDIAFLVGFNDLNYFSKVFKKLTSLTPSQYAAHETWRQFSDFTKK